MNNRDAMFNLLEESGIPYVRVEVVRDREERKESPFGQIADLFEIIMNSLLGDMIISRDEQADYFLLHLHHTLYNLLGLSGSILSSSDRLEELKAKLESMKEEGRVNIPKAFYDAFNEHMEGKEAEEEEGREEEEGK